MAAGTSMPPTAAMTGSATARGSRSSPWTSSRLISTPTSRKNTVIRASLTQACSDRWSRCSSPPSSTRRGVCHISVYESLHGEFAHTMATAAAISMTTPPAASWARTRWSGCTTVRGT